MGELTKQDRANLTWAREIDDKGGTPYLGPTVLKRGPVPECEALVERGLLTRAMTTKRLRHKVPRAAGYHITDLGRQALRPTTSSNGGDDA
ncbi:MAG: hypothetical protein Q7T60_17120 [Sphingopyxis sp.]|nr:hypothetical protein [Sphingopyxis sp.]